jgi:hypothetical protein
LIAAQTDCRYDDIRRLTDLTRTRDTTIIRDTIKEIAPLDGAFIVSKDGAVQARAQ